MFNFYKEKDMVDKVKALVKSRRFWVAVGGVVTVVLQDTLGIDEGTATSLVALGVAWIVGDSLRVTE
jgi:hypothetical protein